MLLPSFASLGLGNLSHRCATGTHPEDNEVLEIDRETFHNNVTNRSSNDEQHTHRGTKRAHDSDTEGDPLEAITGTVKKDDEGDYYYVVADDGSKKTDRWVFDNEVVHNMYPSMNTISYMYVGLKNDDSPNGDLRIFENASHNHWDESLTGDKFKKGEKVTFVPVETNRLKTEDPDTDTIVKIERDDSGLFDKTNWKIPSGAKGVACRIAKLSD